MATATLLDGRQVRVPDNLNAAELNNYIASNFPVLAAETGRYVDYDTEYDFESEIKDAGLRYDLAAASTAEEYSNVLNQKFGQGNWGFTEYGKAFIRPEGRRQAGYEVTDDRKVLVDSAIAPFSYHDLVDVAPEAIKAGAATAAVVLAPLTGGSSTALLSGLLGRSIAARGFQAAFGDVAANVGIEAVQAAQDQQLESNADLFSRIGLEGAIVFGASVVPDSLFRGIGSAAGKLKNIKMAADEADGPIAQIGPADYVAAREAAKQMVPESDVPFMTLHTLVSQSGSPLGSMLSRLEATGRKFGGGVNVQEAREFISKMQGAQAQINKGAVAPDPVSIMNYYRGIMSKANNETAKKVYNLFENYNKTPFGQADMAAKNVYRFKENAGKAIYNNYNAFQRIMKGEDFYGSPLLQSANQTVLTNQQLKRLVEDISRQTGFEPSLILQKLSIAKSDLPNRLSSRLSVTPAGGVKLGKGKGEDIKVGNLRDIDSDLRRAAYTGKELNPAQTYENLEISVALNKAMEKLPGLGENYMKKFKAVNATYAQGSQVFKGGPDSKISLMKLFDGRDIDAEKMLNRFIRGGAGGEIDAVLSAFRKAFDKKTVGAADPAFLSMSTADQLVSQLAHTFVRDLRMEVGRSFRESGLEAGQATAKRVLTRLNAMEENLRKQGAGRTGVAVRQALGKEYISDFKKLLRETQEGQTARSFDAQNILTQAFNYGSYKELITEVSGTVNKLGNTGAVDTAIEKLALMKRADPKGAKFYQDLHYAESVSELMEAFGKATTEEQLSAINKVTQNWITGLQSNGKDKLKDLFGDGFEGLNTTMLVARGATQFGESGTLFTAQLPFSVLNGVIKRDIKGIARPLSMMYAIKSMGPGTSVWKKLSKDMENMIKAGKSPEQAVSAVQKKNSGAIKNALKNAQSMASAAMAGRAGFIGAAIGNYMEEDHDNLPAYEDLPNAPVQEMPQEQPEQPPQQQSMVSPETGLAAIQQIASMLQPQPVQNVGVSSLEEGAEIARSVA